ncbi:MAG: sulfotransferase [Anaerolineales bacterium]
MSDSEKTIYVVSGLPRSGTSMMMKMLEAGGLIPLIDNIRIADDDNLQGYYEFERVKAMKDGDVEWVSDAQGKVIKVISALLENLPSTYQYKVVFMEREMMEILASQRKMLERRGKPSNPAEDGKFAELYARHLEKIKTWLVSQPNMNVLYVRYNDMVTSPEEYAQKVAAFLGVPMNIAAMGNIPQEQFYRQRK